jgi:alcohol dehydrogenase
VTTRRNAVSQLFALEAWRLLEPSLPVVLREPQDLPARAAMQLGAHFAGAAIEQSMLGATHALANPLTAHYGLAHGLAIALMLPHVIRYNGPAVEDLFATLAAAAGLRGEAPADALAGRVDELAHSAGLPRRLRDVGVSEGMLTVLADEAAEQWTGKFNPRAVGFDELLRLYREAL